MQQQSMVTASLHQRMACWLYEGLLLYAVWYMASYLFGALSQTRHALDNRHALQAFVFVVSGIYFVWFWSKGQTLAMKTWNIRLVDRHQAPVTQARALARYCLCWVWLLPPALVTSLLTLTAGEIAAACIGWVVVWASLSYLHPDRQFWHDAWAGTRLVRVTPIAR
jgi:uncharacterized RDD family membrane protein YckC